MATPNSYMDPYWSQLASATEDQIGLPKGLLKSIVTDGGKSNHDRMSEAGARTVFQIIPATQKAAIKKYGIDPYLSNENAAKVAGLLLKDSLSRNGNDVASAVAEYHGGVDRKNWGPRTRAYTQRVVGAVTPQQAPREAVKPPSSETMAAVHQAYMSGGMAPEDAAQYEKDIQSGLVTVPQSAPRAAPQEMTEWKPNSVWQGASDILARGNEGAKKMIGALVPERFSDTVGQAAVDLTGASAAQRVAQGQAYGDRLTTGSGQTLQLKDDVLDAAGFALPVVGTVAQGAGKFAKAVAQAPSVVQGSRAAQRGIVKLPGGNWTEDSVEGMVRPLKSQSQRGSYIVPQDEIDRIEALNSWVDKKLTPYIKNDMATERDPIRKLAEEGIVHKPEGGPIDDVYRKRAVENRLYGQFPIEGSATSNQARTWETTSDAVFAKPDQVANPYKPGETMLVHDLQGYNQAEDLGFDHIMDVLREQMASGELTPDKLTKVTVADAVRRTHAYDQVAAKKAALFKAQAAKDAPIAMEFPNGDKIIQLNKPGMFAAESDSMGHSVRGYEPPKGHADWVDPSGTSGSGDYGHGGWDAIKSGKAEVYSLRDGDNKSFATIETSTSPALVITQIKGPGNKPVDPAKSEQIAQFLNSKEWGSVNDLDKVGVYDIRSEATLYNLARDIGFGRIPDGPIPDLMGRGIAKARSITDSLNNALKAKGVGRFVTKGTVLAALGMAGAAGAAPVLPTGVLDAYISGRMSPEDKKELENDVRSGDVKMPERYTLGQDGTIRFDAESQIPTAGPGPGPVPQAITPPNPVDTPTTILDKAKGVAETGLSTITGLTGGTLGMVAGAGAGVIKSIADGTYGTREGTQSTEAMATEGMQALTYAPRTETGQRYTENVGKVLQATVPVMPLTGELGMLSRAAPAVKAGVAPASAATAKATKKAAEPVTNAAKALVAKAKDKAAPTPGTAKSGGSAGTDMATMRQANADSLPTPIKLTEGQATRSFKQQQFEAEAAKNPELGAPLQDRYAEQRQAVRQNFDSFLDSTGAIETTARGVGQVVDEALKSRLARDKAEVRVAYKNAEKAGEMEAPVTLSTLVDHLNENGPQMRAGMNDLGVKAKKLMVELGAAKEGPDGLLIPQAVPIKTAVLIRRGINEATTVEPPVIRQSAIMKGLVDDATDSAGGKLYKEANALRARMGANYEKNAAVKSLLGKKPGTNDRSVALEDVFHASILKGSLDDVRHIRKVLQTEGAKGTQAWKELQGATLRHIEDQAISNVGKDTHGNQMISPAKLDKAVRSLDADGKLNFIFGKQGAEQIRLLNDVSRDIFTSPVGSVNHSNTASVLLAAMDMAMSGTAGVPLPIMSGLRMISNRVKDRKLKARIEAALRNKGPKDVKSNN